MPKPLLLMDLDRTLFDTALFFERVWDHASARYGLDAEAEKAKASQFHRMYGDMYNYRLFDHLRSSVGPGFEPDSFISGAVSELAGLFVYPDVTPRLMERVDAILTFGDRDEQMFKLALSPALQGVQVHAVLEPKGGYISRTFDVPVVLVDDKDILDEIRPPATFIRIDRSSDGEGARRGHVITTLEDVLGIVDDIAQELTNDSAYANVKS